VGSWKEIERYKRLIKEMREAAADLLPARKYLSTISQHGGERRVPEKRQETNSEQK